jgi:tetratricopeptide (TPR) repeat protein
VRRLLPSALLAGVALLPLTAAAQEPPTTSAIVSRALEAESAGRNREAITQWRAAIAAGAVLPGALGLERVFSLLAQEESVLVALDTLVPRYPRELQLRSIQLRSLVTLLRSAEADAVFQQWRVDAPKDVTPYREYARVLLFNSRPAAADTVLRLAAETLGSTRVLVLEIAQMRAALGQWKESAAAWRAAMNDEPYYESATVFALTPTPVASRDAVRGELAQPGASIGSAHALSLLEVAWGSPRNGWSVLATLMPSDTAVAIWRQFALEVERVQAWATARDALVALHAARPDPAVALRGATAALGADDAPTALRLAREAGVGLDSARRLREVLPIELEAMARLGQAREAEQRLAAAAPGLGVDGLRPFARTIAWAWIRAGDIAKARMALKDAPLDAEDAVTGWLALFEGDLKGARLALRNQEVPGQDAVTALALLNRTRADTSTAIGGAFLSLARRDSAQASRRFEGAVATMPDAAPLLLALAARIETARQSDERGMALWQRLATDHEKAPEAPEAHLELARGYKRRGNIAAARERLEHLIINYPGSALVPQARRELDALRTGVTE